jgi:Holliday junction resolvase
MPLNSRAKGKRGELQWVNYLKEHGYPARRSVQHSGRGGGPFDVIAEHCPIPDWEVKLEEKLNLWAAMDRAAEDGKGKAWALAWRRKQKKWIVVIEAEKLMELLGRAGE